MPRLTDHISSEILEQFRDLGAVRAGCMLVQRPHWSTGTFVDEPDSNLVYFFDAREREIGYWTCISPWCGPVILAPNYRVWSPAFLARMVYEPLGQAGTS